MCNCFPGITDTRIICSVSGHSGSCNLDFRGLNSESKESTEENESNRCIFVGKNNVRSRHQAFRFSEARGRTYFIHVLSTKNSAIKNKNGFVSLFVVGSAETKYNMQEFLKDLVTLLLMTSVFQFSATYLQIVYARFAKKRKKKKQEWKIRKLIVLVQFHKKMCLPVHTIIKLWLF